jgi:hypothetical protein
VNSEIINRKRTDIENRLKYFALFPNASNNGLLHFELHTGKGAMGDSQVAKLLGHDLQAHSSWLELKPFKKEDKFSDKTNAEWVFGDPDFKPDAFFRGVGPRIVSLKPLKECFYEIDEDEASQKSTERMRSPKHRTDAQHVALYTQYNATCCNFLCMTTKPKQTPGTHGMSIPALSSC